MILAILCEKKDIITRHRRRKLKEDGDQENNSENENENDNEIQKSSSTSVESTITDDDGIFTVTIGSTPTATLHNKENSHKHIFVPCPRINPGLVMKHNVLYLYGGMFENGNQQYTLNDLYSLGMYIVIVEYITYTCIMKVYKITPSYRLIYFFLRLSQIR